MSNRAMNVIDFFTLDVNGAVGLTSASPPLIKGKMSGKTVYRMIITNDGADVMWRADGTAPTDTVGHLLGDGGSISFTGANYKSLINSIQFIKVAATSQICGTVFD